MGAKEKLVAEHDDVDLNYSFHARFGVYMDGALTRRLQNHIPSI